MTQLSFDGAEPEPPSTHAALIVYCDGGARGNPGPAAIGAVVLDAASDPPVTLATVSETIGVATNNVAEYRALIAGLEAAAPFAARAIEVRADSQLLVYQLQGRYRVKHPNIKPLYERACALLRPYERTRFVHVPREENTVADALVNAALDGP